MRGTVILAQIREKEASPPRSPSPGRWWGSKINLAGANRGPGEGDAFWWIMRSARTLCQIKAPLLRFRAYFAKLEKGPGDEDFHKPNCRVTRKNAFRRESPKIALFCSPLLDRGF